MSPDIRQPRHTGVARPFRGVLEMPDSTLYATRWAEICGALDSNSTGYLISSTPEAAWYVSTIMAFGQLKRVGFKKKKKKEAAW